MNLKNKGSIFFKKTVFFRRLGFIISCGLVLFLASCASLPEDVMISTASEEEIKVVEKVAQDLAYLDGTSILGNTHVATAAQLLETIQDTLENPNLSAQVRGQLVAFRGRVNLILGDIELPRPTTKKQFP